MAKNFNGTQINQSVTISETAGAEIADVRNRIVKYDDNGNVVLATAGTDIPVGIAIIEAGINDISGEESGKVEEGGDVDIQIKDIGYVIAGEAITKGQEVTAGADGLAVPAKTGNYIIGFALKSVEKDGYCRVQISKFQKN
jgi:hypothetical protein